MAKYGPDRADLGAEFATCHQCPYPDDDKNLKTDYGSKQEIGGEEQTPGRGSGGSRVN